MLEIKVQFLLDNKAYVGIEYKNGQFKQKRLNVTHNKNGSKSIRLDGKTYHLIEESPELIK